MSSPQTELRSDHPPAAAGHQMFTRKSWNAIGCSLKLSPRELEIVSCFFDDDHEQTIADSLCISVHTVHTHISRLYQKLGVNSRLGVVVRIFAEYLSLDLACEDCD